MGKLVARLCSLAMKLVFYLLVYGTPLLGIWLATSLAAYLNGPFWLPLAAGILFFPVLPLLWEIWATKRRKRKKAPKARVLTFGDRITLRTLVLSVLFITSLLIWHPQSGFLALSTRGDWMLENGWARQKLSADQLRTVRKALFSMADGLEWLYVALHENPYGEYVEEKYAEDASGRGVKPRPLAEVDSKVWPWKNSTLHPAVVKMPASAEGSIASVARYIAGQENDPFLRIKALHDYVADRVAYDAKSFAAGRYPPQDAQTVFATRKAVCAGYANLLAALGDVIGEDIVVVTGDSRNQSGAVSGGGHAWNAAKIEDNWYLIDATWDSGYVEGAKFTKQYRTDYLLPPPEIIAITHFPENPQWQLSKTPLSRGEFLRQPMMRPAFFAESMMLLSPTRSQSDVRQAATLLIDNPSERWMLANFVKKGEHSSVKCDVVRGAKTSISCALPSPGTYEVSLFSSGKQYGTYQFVGRVEFNKRG